MLTSADIQQLRELERRATPSPWEWVFTVTYQGGGDKEISLRTLCGPDRRQVLMTQFPNHAHGADAMLIPAMRTALRPLLDAWDELQALKEHRQTQIDLLEAELAETQQIVNRVWAALGITSSAEAQGKMIYEIVAELKAERLERADWRAQGEEASDDPT